jgi:pyruvate,water dikinase
VPAQEPLFRFYDEALTLMADIERAEHSRGPVEMDTVKRLFDRLHLAVQKMLVALGDLGDPRSEDLLKTLQQFTRQTTPLFDPALSIPTHPILLPLSEIRAEMTAFVGHKAACLGDISRSMGLPVPDGFVLTARAFDDFMAANDLTGLIEAYLHGIDLDRTGPIQERCEHIRRLILQAPVPGDIERAVRAEMERWAHRRAAPVFTSVRSTAVGEDMEISFAGQFATLLNVPPDRVLTAYKEVIASKYSAGAILYRMRYGLEDRATPMAVLVMAMIPATASGIVYTRHPSAPDREALHISAIHGLGEYLMSGDIAPHVINVDRRSGGVCCGHSPRQTHWMTCSPAGGTRLASIPTEKAFQAPLDTAAVRCLAAWGTRLEKYFGAPQDIEWALDPQKRLYVLQSRPLGLDGPPATESKDLLPLEKLPVLHRGGRTACSGVITGRLYRPEQDLAETTAADSILLIPKAAPEYAPLIGRVRGVIAVRGSAASHLASVAREFGVPMIVDCGPIDERWKQGLWVTLHADQATVYLGKIDQRTVNPSPQSLGHLIETPVRRRLRALSNRIVPRGRTAKTATSSSEPSASLHDLVYRALGFAMETLHARRPAAKEPFQVIRWTPDNAACDFSIKPLDRGPMPDASVAPAPAPCWGKTLLQALWKGMGGPGDHLRPAALLKTGGWALIAGNALQVRVTVGGQQISVRAIWTAERAIVNLHLRVAGGDGPYYKRCLRTAYLAGILDEMGCTVKIRGALLDATATLEGLTSSERQLAQIGRLVTFTRQTDRQLVGPWVLMHLQEVFKTGAPAPGAAQTPDLPTSVRALTGNWRQTTLDGCGVVVHDGAAVQDWRLPPLKNSAGRCDRDYRAFFEQLHRDHFVALAVADDSRMRDGQIDLAINLVGGRQACAGGVVFGYSDPGRYFVMGLDARRKHLVLYETIHGRRFKRLRKRFPVHTNRWYDVVLHIAALNVQIHVDGVPLIAYTADGPIAGRAGLWAWDDTVVVFDGLALIAGTRRNLAG